MAQRRDLKERFESHIFPEPNTGCFLTDCKAEYYPKFSIEKGVVESTHRLSYRLYKGAIPKNMHVCHSCDNIFCMNPDHLFLGTAGDNQRDKIKKNRHARGSKLGISKLTEQNVLEIRNLYASGKYKYSDIAVKYGVGVPNISSIINGRSWGWLK